MSRRSWVQFLVWSLFCTLTTSWENWRKVRKVDKYKKKNKKGNNNIICNPNAISSNFLFILLDNIVCNLYVTSSIFYFLYITWWQVHRMQDSIFYLKYWKNIYKIWDFFSSMFFKKNIKKTFKNLYIFWLFFQ